MYSVQYLVTTIMTSLYAHIRAEKEKKWVFSWTEHYKTTVDLSKPSQEPFQIMDKNIYKSGVNTVDHMAGGYMRKRGTQRWPLAMFYNMLNVAGLSTFVIHDKLGHVNRNDQKFVFLMELA